MLFQDNQRGARCVREVQVYNYSRINERLIASVKAES